MVNNNRIPTEYKHLGLLMLMPLIDGVFVSIVLSGGLDSTKDAIMVGSFVLGGGATIGVILSEFTDSKEESIKKILLISTLVLILATLQASFAPSIEPFLNIDRFKIGSMIALIILSYNIIPLGKNRKFIRPGYIILVTIILSVDIQNTSLSIIINDDIIVNVLIAVITSSIISIITVIIRPYVIDYIIPEQMQYITALSLFFVSLSIGNIVSDDTPLVIFSMGIITAIIINKLR